MHANLPCTCGSNKTDQSAHDPWCPAALDPDSFEAKALAIDVERGDAIQDIEALMYGVAETGEQFAEVCRLEAEWQAIHGPKLDPMRGVEFPFAGNH